MLKRNHGPFRRVAGLLLACAIAMGGFATAGAAQEKAKEETKAFEKKIVIHHVDGQEDVLKHGSPGELRATALNCPGERFEVSSAGGDPSRKEDVKFFICTKAGGEMLKALEKAEADIQKQDDMPADPKAEILSKIRAKISELRAKG